MLQQSADMKTRRIILAGCGICLGILLLIGLTFDLLSPGPVPVAKEKSVAEGWEEQKLSLLSFQTSGGLFGSTGHVEFQVQGSNPPKTIRVEMQRPMYSPNWQVVGFKESPAKGE